MLAINKDGSVTIGEKRHGVLLESAWELEALANLLPKVACNEVPEALQSAYQVRCIASRIRALASVLMSGLSDELAPTVELVKVVEVTG